MESLIDRRTADIFIFWILSNLAFNRYMKISPSRKVKILKIIFQPQFLYFFFIKDSFLIKYWILENNLIKVPNFLLEKKRSLKFLYLYLINEISLSINWLLFYIYVYFWYFHFNVSEKKKRKEWNFEKKAKRSKDLKISNFHKNSQHWNTLD